MRYVLYAVGVAFLCGCSGGKTELKTTPFTDEQKQRIAEEDRKIAEEEGGRPAKARTSR